MILLNIFLWHFIFKVAQKIKNSLDLKIITIKNNKVMNFDFKTLKIGKIFQKMKKERNHSQEISI